MLGLEKQGWQAVHINIALLFLIVAGLHLYLNWGMFWGYIKKKASFSANLKLEMLVAILIAGGVLVGTIEGVSPFGALLTLNYRIKDYWEREPVTAPIPHAEELSLGQLADKLDVPVEQVIEALKQEGIAVENDTTTIAQLAEKNRLTPSDVYAAIKKHFPEVEQPRQGKGRGKGQGKGGGFGPGRGQGRGMGRELQEQNGR
jgi:biotin operon repressor